MAAFGRCTVDRRLEPRPDRAPHSHCEPRAVPDQGVVQDATDGRAASLRQRPGRRRRPDGSERALLALRRDLAPAGDAVSATDHGCRRCAALRCLAADDVPGAERRAGPPAYPGLYLRRRLRRSTVAWQDALSE